MAAGREKKLICGPEGEIVVAHGRLPSPAHRVQLEALHNANLNTSQCGG